MIRAEHLTYSYSSGCFANEKIPVIKGVSLSVRSNESVGLIGKSGSGKTTIGRLLVRSLKPSSGTIWYNDTNITSLSRSQIRPIRNKLQMLFQDPQSSLNPKMTAGQSISEPFNLYHKKLKPGEVISKVKDLINEVGLSNEHLSRYPNQLSGGQNQRVMIARILALRPAFLVADEPTASLDVSVQAQILRLLQKVQDDYGMGILLISHDPEIIECMCSRVYEIENGQILNKKIF